MKDVGAVHHHADVAQPVGGVGAVGENLGDMGLGGPAQAEEIVFVAHAMIVGWIAEVLRKQSSGAAVVGDIAEKTATLDSGMMSLDLDRATRNTKENPEDAVTAVCATLEAVCWSILIELGLDLPAKKDVSAIVRAVQEPLGLSPGRTTLPGLIAADIRKVLSGLTTATEGIGALRTHGSDAHGQRVISPLLGVLEACERLAYIDWTTVGPATDLRAVSREAVFRSACRNEGFVRTVFYSGQVIRFGRNLRPLGLFRLSRRDFVAGPGAFGRSRLGGQFCAEGKWRTRCAVTRDLLE